MQQQNDMPLEKRYPLVGTISPGFPRWRCDYVTAAAKSDIEIKAVRTI
ncbi:hypothetical protein [Magnetospirillum sp. ME-1]|nr:hypothetical protein [Magnetospirillum sp. ME-1]